MEPTRLRPVNPAKGFTVVEMIVVVGIITVILAVVIAGQSTFNRSLLLTDIAYTVAFSVREAQALGLSSRSVGGFQNAAYGLHFARASTTSYILFADTFPAPGASISALCPGRGGGEVEEQKPGNCVFTRNAAVTPPVNEEVKSYALNNRFRISRLCGWEGSARYCSTESENRLNTLNITYLRPNTQSTIYGRLSNPTSDKSFSDTSIYIASPDGTERCVHISKVGLVSVLQEGESTFCPTL